MNWTILRQKINQHFDDEELRLLCFDLGTEYENLGGRGKAGKVAELVALYQRNGQIKDLLAQLTLHRSSIEWEFADEATPTTHSLSGYAPVPTTAAERRVRNDFLQKVKTNWIQGILEKSLHNILRLDLGFTYKPEAVSRSWSMTLQQADLPEQELPGDISILEIFRQHQGDLLILGEPGAGKTITLLELSRDLIILAETDETQAIPVVLNLSAWAEKQLPFAAWLEESLLDYQVSRKVGQQWIANDFQLILLLDGLDEVQKEQRDGCVAAINDFRAEHMTDIVICSRLADYEELNTRLNIATAIMLRPLTLAQIDAYLAAGGESLSTLRQMVQEDATLQAMAQTPLLLSIMAMTYRNQPIQAPQGEFHPTEYRHRLFSHYAEYMFKRQGMTPSRIEANDRRLSWLAHHMTLRTQTTFAIDILQRTWLPSKAGQFYFVILVGLCYCLSTALLVGTIFSSFGLGAFIGIGVGLMGVRSAYYFEIDHTSFRERISDRQIRLKSYTQLGHIVAAGLGIGLIALLNINLILNLILGVVAGTVYSLTHSHKNVRFWVLHGISRRNLLRILNYISLGPMVGLFVGLIGYTLGSTGWNPIFTVLLGVLFSLVLWIFFQFMEVLAIFAFYLDCHSRRFILRVLLMLYDMLPWQPYHFLDEMTACGLLRKSGIFSIFRGSGKADVILS
jgi:hypothetical protein